MHRTRTIPPAVHTLFTALLLAIGIILLRLFYLQIIYANYYCTKGQKNFLRVEQVASQRGDITDCNGKLLATNIPITHLYWQGSGHYPLSGTQLAILTTLEKITNTPVCSNKAMIGTISHAERHYKKVQLVQDLTREQLSKIQEYFPNNKNLSVETHFKRHYPHGMCASHVLGYLAKMDTQFYGKMGLEKLCEEILKGEEGTVLKTINSVGRNIASVTLKNAAQGAPIQTTLDVRMQKMCERIFPKNYSGALVVMDPQDGSIRASVSAPSFDPTIFLQPISHDHWHELQTKKPFLNRTLNAYPPGSVFKLVTVSALLETGMLDPEQMWDCTGFVVFAKRKYWCNKRWGHGLLNTCQAVAQSCNTLFFELGKEINIDVLADYGHRFGLGTPTGFLFPERIGIMPSKEWKLNVRGEQWWPGETLSVSIGQSYLLATPLQIARMISGIFTGYLPKPRILMDEQPEQIPVGIKEETLQFLQESMKYVVSRGTGKKVNTVKDIEIYAKTSTAQISDFQMRKLGSEYLEHAWFVAHFTYKDHKPLVFVVVVENAGSSLVATTVAKNFLIAYKDL